MLSQFARLLRQVTETSWTPKRAPRLLPASPGTLLGAAGTLARSPSAPPERGSLGPLPQSHLPPSHAAPPRLSSTPPPRSPGGSQASVVGRAERRLRAARPGAGGRAGRRLRPPGEALACLRGSSGRGPWPGAGRVGAACPPPLLPPKAAAVSFGAGQSYDPVDPPGEAGPGRGRRRTAGAAGGRSDAWVIRAKTEAAAPRASSLPPLGRGAAAWGRGFRLPRWSGGTRRTPRRGWG